MKCKDAEIMIPDFLQGSLAQGALLAFQAHTAHCHACGRLLEEQQQVWHHLGHWEVGEPAPHLRENFYTMLTSFQAGQEAGSAEARDRPDLPHRLASGLRRLVPVSFALQWLFLGAIFALGYLLGHMPASRKADALQVIRRDYETLAHQASLSLMQHQSPSERLSGVRWSTRLNAPDPRVRDALLYILDHDSNVNVRLSAIEALYLYREDPKVRAGLVQALGKAGSPMVQATLIDYLVAMGGKQAAPDLEHLLGSQDLNPFVREKARAGLDQMQ